MKESGIKSLPEAEAIRRIVETVEQADEGTEPFVLVLGSGFSHGLVPTARELVSEGLPLWAESLKGNERFEELKQAAPEQRSNIARAFWKTFIERNASLGLDLPLDDRTGLPTNYAAAYQASFDPTYSGSVGAPAQARRFQRTLMRLDKQRLNAAHFLLASLLGVQPGRTRKSSLFKTRAAFSRLILTTKFDPFLQTALQAVNRLYFMSDTPELGVGDEIFDDDTDAIHLVYLHGSVHRRSQAASEEDIRALKEKNARILKPVLKRHGVIVLGYSGWDDAIVEALAACDHFDHRLYWCGREFDPTAGGVFGPRVPGILRKPASFYVRIEGAGHFMAQLYTRMVNGLPRLLDNPIGQVREMLDTIDLSELENLAPPPVASDEPDKLRQLDQRSHADAFVKAQQSTLQRLVDAEHAFIGGLLLANADEKERRQPGESGRPAAIPATRDSKTESQRLLSSAMVAEALGNHAESFRLCSEALGLGSHAAGEQAELLVARGRASYLQGRLDDAVSDWTKVLELPGAPVVMLARALVNRGAAWGLKNDAENELADYTRVIEKLPDAPAEQVAKARKRVKP